MVHTDESRWRMLMTITNDDVE